MFETFDFTTILNLLQEQNSLDNILLFISIEITIWIFISWILILFLPIKYKKYKSEIFIFFVVINVGLLFIGIILTIIMVLFGLSWATHRISRPSYKSVYFEEQVSDFPMVYSKFHEGILALDSKFADSISSDEKIKSLKILYDSNAQGNIGKIQHFLADSSDETRLYAFALVSSFEKRLNQQLKEIQEKITYTHTDKLKEKLNFELAQTYWQFIYHGVANQQLTGFYTEKIEKILKTIDSNPSALILLGKIQIFNKEYNRAEEYFTRAVELGVPKKSLYTFFAEIKYSQQKYNEIAQYILPEEFDIDLRLKPLISVWRDS
ncbi:Extracellular Matrix protein PelE [hydrothermal vent metagenome]|uniref:Extracellular Matrix protein PelE n=1 Tax=hydrothermal vent metagenome TaxID=652676 RepID=A0A1W1BT46_9ZZZZ